MDALLHAVADAHGGRRRAPEVGERQPDHPEVDLLIERGALGRLRRAGLGIARRGAAGPVGLEAVALDGADVGGMRRLDAEAAHVLRGEIDGDVVLLRAQHRLAGVGHLDGERCGGLGGAAGDDAANSDKHEREQCCHERRANSPPPLRGEGEGVGAADLSSVRLPPPLTPLPQGGGELRRRLAASPAEHNKRPRSWPRAAGRRCGRPCRPWKSSG